MGPFGTGHGPRLTTSGLSLGGGGAQWDRVCVVLAMFTTVFQHFPWLS